MNCQYRRICCLFEYNSFRCGLFAQRCQYHHEFKWYNKETVIKHVDRIRMEQVGKLEEVFDGEPETEIEKQRQRLIKLSGQDKKEGW